MDKKNLILGIGFICAAFASLYVGQALSPKPPATAPAVREAVGQTAANPAGATRWLSMGGTSVGAPQWAGILAVANARRALAGAAPLGRIHASLYGPLAAGSNFNDVTEGSNGTPVWARAGARYDIPTGWGTPRVNAFLAAAVALR